MTTNILANDIDEVIVSTTKSIQQIKTYEFRLVKRELVKNKDTGYYYMDVKLQVDPFMANVKFLKPSKGREAIYRDGFLTIRRGGSIMSDLVLTVDPLSPVAMDDNRYPITHLNPNIVCSELIDKIKSELKFKDTKITSRKAKYDGQAAVYYKLTHKNKEEGMQCKYAEMLISTEHNVPIYFKVVNWSGTTIEEYAFSKIQINHELDDEIFNINRLKK